MTDPIPLNDAQRRHVTVALLEVEAALAEIRQALDPPAGSALLSVEWNDLPAGFAAQAEAGLRDAQTELEALVGRLALRPWESSRRRRLRALCVSTVVHLKDAGTRSLRAYGAVDGLAVAPVLDPPLGRLRESFGRLAALLDQPPVPPEDHRS